MMFNNALNRDTVFFFGMSDIGWQTTHSICSAVNQSGYAITVSQTRELLLAMVKEDRVLQDMCAWKNGVYWDIWKKKRE